MESGVYRGLCSVSVRNPVIMSACYVSATPGRVASLSLS